MAVGLHSAYPVFSSAWIGKTVRLGPGRNFFFGGLNGVDAVNDRFICMAFLLVFRAAETNALCAEPKGGIV